MDNTGIVTDARPIVTPNMLVIFADNITKLLFVEYHSVINCATVITKSAVRIHITVRRDCGLDARLQLVFFCYI